MIEWMVSSCVLTALVIGLRYLLRGRIGVRLQYALWLLVLVRLLLPVSLGSTDISLMSVVEKAPAVQAVESVRNVDAIWQAEDGTVEGTPSGGGMRDAPVKVAPAATSTERFHRMEAALAVRRVLLPVWWCGAGVTLLAFLAANIRFAGRLRKTRRPLAMEGAALTVYVVEERAAPCLFGLFRPAVYVTPDAAADATLLRHTVAHETTHFRHGDHVWALLRTVCLALHWWDPLVWWAARLSRQDGELVCDEATIARLGEGERAAYGRTLIRMACGSGAHPLLTATAMDGGKTSLHERITLLAKKPRTAAAAAVIVVLAAALCAGCVFTGAKKLPEDASPVAVTMAALTEKQLGAVDPEEYPGLKTENLIPALNDAAFHEISMEQMRQSGFWTEDTPCWTVLVPITGGSDLMLSCGGAEDLVEVSDLSAMLSSYVGPQEGSAYVRHRGLYQLVRTARDYPQQLEHPDYENMRDDIEALLSPLTGRLQFGTDDWYTDHEVKVFAKVWSYDEDGERVDMYRLRALAYARPEEVEELSMWLSLDSQGRYYAVNWWGYAAVRQHNGALLGLVPLNEDGSGYSSDSFAGFREDDGWQERMLTAWQAWLQEAGAAEAEANAVQDVAAFLRGVRPEDVVLDFMMYPKLTGEQVTAALNGAAEHGIPEEQALVAEGFSDSYPFWWLDLSLSGEDVNVSCGLAENVVCVRTTSSGTGYFKDETLYELVRHSRDYDETIDQSAYAMFRTELDAVMQRELDYRVGSPGEFRAYELANFSPIWHYATDDGNRAEWYSFDFALIPGKPEADFWAGGMYMDSRLRVRGFSVSGSVVARYRGDTLLGLVFMGNDDSYVPAFDEDWDWANAMLTARDGC